MIFKIIFEQEERMSVNFTVATVPLFYQTTVTCSDLFPAPVEGTLMLLNITWTNIFNGGMGCFVPLTGVGVYLTYVPVLTAVPASFAGAMGRNKSTFTAAGATVVHPTYGFYDVSPILGNAWEKTGTVLMFATVVDTTTVWAGIFTEGSAIGQVVSEPYYVPIYNGTLVGTSLSFTALGCRVHNYIATVDLLNDQSTDFPMALVNALLFEIITFFGPCYHHPSPQPFYGSAWWVVGSAVLFIIIAILIIWSTSEQKF